jgi:hypothetical protein
MDQSKEAQERKPTQFLVPSAGQGIGEGRGGAGLTMAWSGGQLDRNSSAVAVATERQGGSRQSRVGAGAS